MGLVPRNPEERTGLLAEGWEACLNPRCDYMLSPEDEAGLEEVEYEFRCPRCKSRYNWLSMAPFGNEEDNLPQGRRGGRATTVGLSMKQQGDIGENLIQQQGELPGYGRLVWWSTDYNDPIDGATEEWAIEVKTIAYDAKHHRFIPGSPETRGDKMARATQMGYDKLLGVLVILDFRRSVADVYVKEMSVSPWKSGNGRMIEGFATFRKDQGAMHFLEEVPFQNPFLDPNSQEPQLPNSKDWFQDESPFGQWNKNESPEPADPF